MNLSTLFHDLSVGELSNLGLAGSGDGTISAAAQPKITLFANDALVKLYSRFVLKEADVLLTLHEDITHYHLIPRFAVNYTPVNAADDEEIRYIVDTEQEPFLGDVIKILRVFDDTGTRLPLNDTENSYSVFTPQAKILQVMNPIADSMLSVQYQARHATLEGDPDEFIDLPEVLYSAFRAYIAHRVYLAMNTQDGQGQAQILLASYEAECQKVLEGDLVSTSISTSNTRFEKRGWI